MFLGETSQSKGKQSHNNKKAAGFYVGMRVPNGWFRQTVHDEPVCVESHRQLPLKERKKQQGNRGRNRNVNVRKN